jgi:hypothetical protein
MKEVHSGLPPFTCRIKDCAASFMWRVSYENHLHAVHAAGPQEGSGSFSLPDREGDRKEYEERRRVGHWPEIEGDTARPAITEKAEMTGGFRDVVLYAVLSNIAEMTGLHATHFNLVVPKASSFALMLVYVHALDSQEQN